MRRTVIDAWHKTPDDAARVIFVAVLMPAFFWSYLLGWDQQASRAIFSACLGALGWLIGALIEDLPSRLRDAQSAPPEARTKEDVRLAKIAQKRRMLGFAVSTCALASMVAAIGALVVLEDPTWTWRTVTAGTQATIVGGWCVLWRCRKRWLSHAVARWCFIASAVGLVTYLLTNFWLADPALVDPAVWGSEQAKGIARRVLRLPVDAMTGIALWTMLVLTWRRFLLKHWHDD